MKRTALSALLMAAMLPGVAAVAQKVPAHEPAGETYWPTQGWRVSTPEAQGMDSDTLAQAFDYIRQHQIPIHSLLIVRHGYVVLDAYFYPFQQGQVHDGASVTKSVTATLIGINIGEHRLGGLHQPVLALFPQRSVRNPDPRKEHMTIEHLLTMTSGLDCHFDHGEMTLRQMTESKDWVQFMLDLPMAAEPGGKFEYCSGGMHLLSGIVSQATGTSGFEFARRELFLPLGIEDAGWPSDAQGVSHGWGDLRLQPRDMVKLGYLWLHQGRWEGRQIVPGEWVREATQTHSHPNFGSGEYGYGFWVYPQRTPFLFEALGRGGQRISIVPGKDLIVVFTGGGFEPGDVGTFIGQAIKSDLPLLEDPAGAARLAAAVRAAGDAPPAAPVKPAPPVSQSVSGRRYAVEANPMGLSSFSLTFPGGSEAVAHLEFADGRVEERPLGLDGVPRLSAGGRYGLPVAAQGSWEGADTFVLEYDEVANINCYELRLAFFGNEVTIQLRERTGLARASFRGKRTDAL
jgi:CubicO group peptidase (beta-lactamase class C family)